MSRKIKNIFNLIISSSPAVAIVSTAVVVPLINKNNSDNNNLGMDSNNINHPLSTLPDDILIESSPFNENIYRSVDEIREHYLSKYYDNVLIQVDNHKANVIISNDSYQQSNRIEYSQPKSTLSFKYERAAFVESDKFNNNIVEQLNDSSINEWKYNVRPWWAKAKQRYTGNIILVPTWAPEVLINHPAKEYNSIDSSYLNPEKEFLYSFYKRKILPKIDDYISNATTYILEWLSKIGVFQNILDNIKLEFPWLKLEDIIKRIEDYFDDTKNFEKFKDSLNNWIKNKIINIMDNYLGSKEIVNTLKPILKNKIPNYKFKKVDFGVFNVKYLNVDELSFESNNALPITDYTDKYVCRGTLCSHHNRHLLDVTLTSLKSIVLDNFFGNDILTPFSITLVFTLLNLYNDKDLTKFILTIFEFNKRNNYFLDEFSEYLNKNAKRILLTYFGMVEKHGYQIGKCGHLVSGIKIHSRENVVNIKNNKPLIQFTGNYNLLFNDKINGYNLNTFYCINELSNYKKLYNFLNSQDIDKNIKKILIYNIQKRTAPSEEIYNDYLKFKENLIIPFKYDFELNSFKQFKKEGWKIPINIENWDILDDFVLPTLFTKNYFIIDKNNKRQYIYKNNKFVNNNDNSGRTTILMDNFFNEPVRF